MVTPPAGGEEAPACVGIPHIGPVRYSPQRQAVSVLLSDPESSSPVRGRLPSPLGRPRHVLVPPLLSGRKGSGSSQRDPKSLNDSSCPPLAGEGVVRRPTPPPNPTTAGTSTVGTAATTAALQPVPRRRPRPEPSLVATLKRLLRKSGFTRGAALEMSSCVRESTARLYQSQWLSFCGWCRVRGVTPVDATIPGIVDFLVHLRRDKSFSLSALKGCRAAISSVLSLKGVDPANSRELTMLFRSFSKSCSPTDLRPPVWDVALVLQSLTVAPYELLRGADERYLAHKTLFLVALTSAKRVGELHALLIVSLTLWVGRRCPSVLSPASWPKPRTSPPSTPALRASRFQPYLSQETPPPPPPPQRETPMSGTSCQMLPSLHLQTSAGLQPTVRHNRSYQEGNLKEHGLLLAPTGNIPGLPAIGETPSSNPPPSTGDPRYCSVAAFQEELRRQPGPEGRYVAPSHHLHAPLPQGLGTQVPRYLPLGPCGGGSGHGMTWPPPQDILP